MRPLFVTAIAGSVLALSACGGSAEPPEAAPPSSSGTPAESASPSGSRTPEAEVTLPAEVQGTSTEAARQTVLLFIDEINRAGQNGDTRLVRQLFTEDCENCESIVGAIERIYAAGGSVDGDTWTQQEIATPRPGPQDSMGVASRVVAAPQTVTESAGAEAVRYTNGQKRIQSFTLVKRDQRWVIVTFLNGRS